MTNTIKQAAEFGIVQSGQNLAGLLIFLTDVHGIGLQAAQGLIFTEAFYWDMNDGTRAWSKRFAERNGGKYPSMIHAGVYAGLLHYLKAVDAVKSDTDGAKVVAQMKQMPTEDALFGKGEVRVDGRTIHDVYLFEVKKPAESKGGYDLYKLRARSGSGSVPAARPGELPVGEERLIALCRQGPPMFELLGVPPQALFGQLMLGLINGAFYAMLSLGLAVIFGLLNIINFAHGALYMMGAFVAWFRCSTSDWATGGRSSCHRSPSACWVRSWSGCC